MHKLSLLLLACFTFTFSSCQELETPDEEELMMIDQEEINMNEELQAVITAVEVTGTDNNYTFSVTIKSPDTGCKQYADWWEVFDQEGNLLYRRILGHSHVDEQPFTRSGGPVKITEDQFIFVRAHMNPLGYGSFGFGGTIKEGLKAEMIGLNIGAELEETAPLPTGCAF